MSGFDERQKGYENKFAHDQEMEFKVRSRRNKMLARWAAELMCLEDGAVDAYTSEVLDYTFSNSTDDLVCNKIVDDIRNKGFKIEDREVRAAMDGFLLEARESFR